MKVERKDCVLHVTPEMVVKAFEAAGYLEMTALACNQDKNQFLWEDNVNGIYGVNTVFLTQDGHGVFKAECGGVPIKSWDMLESDLESEAGDEPNVDKIMSINHLQHFLDANYFDSAPTVLAVNSVRNTFLWLDENKNEYSENKFIVDEGKVWVLNPPVEVWKLEADPEDETYDTSVDFTSDMEKLTALLEQAKDIVTAPKFEDWVRKTDNNYGSELRFDWQDLVNKVTATSKASTKFEQDMIDLD